MITEDLEIDALISCTPEVLEEKMKAAGFEVEFIGKPFTLEDIKGRPYRGPAAILTEERVKVRRLAREKGGYGCLILDYDSKTLRSRDEWLYESFNLNLLIYNLSEIKD